MTDRSDIGRIECRNRLRMVIDTFNFNKALTEVVDG